MSYRLEKRCVVARTITSRDTVSATRDKDTETGTSIQFAYRATQYETLHEFPVTEPTRIKGFYGTINLSLEATCALPSVFRLTLFVYNYLDTYYQDDGIGNPPVFVRSKLTYPETAAKIPRALKFSSVVLSIAPCNKETLTVEKNVEYTMRSKRNDLVHRNGVSKVTRGKSRKAGTYACFTCKDVIACAISLETNDPEATINVFGTISF